MWIVAFLGVVAVLLWYGNKRRGQRFVRAVHFLDLLDGGASPDEANGKVARLFTKHSSPVSDVAAIEHATDRANRFTEGKQLPWLDEARQRGFIIDSGNTRFDLAHLSQAQPQTDTDQLSRAQPALSDVYYVGLDRIRASASKLMPAIVEVADTAIRWGLWGLVVGFIIGLFVPKVLFGHLAVWAIPIITAFSVAWVGLAIGAAYSALRWVFTR